MLLYILNPFNRFAISGYKYLLAANENSISAIEPMEDHKLDNPVWYSLLETHRPFSVDYGSVKFYHPDYCPFGGIDTSENVSKYIDKYATLVDDFFLLATNLSFQIIWN